MARRGSNWLAFLIGVGFAPSLRADLQIRVQETSPQGGASTVIHYYKEHLWRWGPPGAGYTIVDTANRGVVTVDPAARQYSVLLQGKQPQPEAVDSSETIVVQIETRDTGEQRSMFGHAARHFITTENRHTEYRDRPPSTTEEIVTDGWYLDILGPLPALTRVGTVTYLSFSGAHGRINRPKIEVARTGPVPRGLAVWEKTGDYVKEVTEFSEAPIDAKLFEVPEGFRRVVRPFPGQALSWSDQLIVYWQELQDWLSRLL